MRAGAAGKAAIAPAKRAMKVRVMTKNFHEDLSGAFLLGDIGGTNARFSLVDSGRKHVQVFSTAKTADFQNIDDAIAQHILPLAEERPENLILAVAAPIEGNIVRMTNCHWAIEPEALIKRFNLKRVVLINDFEAQALAVAALSTAYLKPIGGGVQNPYSSRVVLGPGTGLGVAGIASCNCRFLPVTSEGGHVDFAPHTPRDFALMPYLLKGRNRISAEKVLSGGGFLRIYSAICAADGIAPDLEDAAAITGAAHEKSNAQAAETVALFLTYLARFCGDFAMVFKAHGGVYIGGGIVPKIISLLDETKFRQEFEDKGRHKRILETIPIYVMTHPRAALEGMESLARKPRDYMIDYHDRLWTAEGLESRKRK